MNDDELIERLRSTLRAEADAVTPMHGTPRVTPRRRRHRSRRDLVLNRVVVVLAGAAAVAAAIAVTLGLGHGGAHRTSGTYTSSPSAPVPTTVGRRVVPVAPTAVAPPTTLPPTTAAPSTTVPPPAAQSVPVSFQPRSITFISANLGWVVGTEPCATGTCVELAQRDGAGHWTEEGGPTLASIPEAGRGELQVRFANQEDGWIFEVGRGTLWSTIDGGSTWATTSLPGALQDLETAGGTVVALTKEDGGVAVYSSAVTTPAFRQVDGIAAPAGGTASTATLVMQSHGGRRPVAWVLESNDQGVDGGLRLVDGVWSTWIHTPCSQEDGTVLLAASDYSQLVAACDAAGSKGAESVQVSSDGGTAFALAGGGTPEPITSLATPAAGTIVGVSSADQGALVASIGSGPWRTVQPSVQAGARIVQVGFEDSAQGVAVVETASGGTLLETVDGGRQWGPVSLQR